MFKLPMNKMPSRLWWRLLRQKVRINLSGALVVAVLLVPPVLPAHARRLTLPVRRLLHWRLQRNFLSEGKARFGALLFYVAILSFCVALGF